MSKTTVGQLGLTSFEMSLSINKAQRAFNELLKTCLGHHGLTIPEWAVLGKLYKDGNARPMDMARVLGITPPFITKTTRSLVGRQLVNTVMHPDDERGKTLALSASGRQLVEMVELKLEDCLNGQLGALAEADLQTFFTLNQYIAENVHHH